MKMNCTKCGNALPESESPFCPFCGEDQGAAPDAVSTPATDQDVTAPADNNQAQEEMHPLTAKAMAGKPVAESAAAPASSGSFPANAAGQAPSPFGAPPVQEKKRLPGWAIALIAGGIVFVLAICCCLAIVTLGLLDDLESGELSGTTTEIVIPPIDDTGDNNADDNDAADVPSAPAGAISFGDTFEFDDFEITFGTAIRWITIDASFSDHHGAEVFQVPITVTNIGDETDGLNMFSFTQFSPDGNSQDFFSLFLVDDDVTTAGSIRPGGTQESYMSFLYEGNGDYVVEFSVLFSNEVVEVVLPITQP